MLDLLGVEVECVGWRRGLEAEMRVTGNTGSPRLPKRDYTHHPSVFPKWGCRKSRCHSHCAWKDPTGRENEIFFWITPAWAVLTPEKEPGCAQMWWRHWWGPVASQMRARLVMAVTEPGSQKVNAKCPPKFLHWLGEASLVGLFFFLSLAKIILHLDIHSAGIGKREGIDEQTTQRT